MRVLIFCVRPFIMSVIEFSPALELSHADMDGTHREFVELLNRIADTPDAELTGVLDQFITHTEAHFAQEQKWMEEIQFPPLHCHVREHEGVLEISREVRNRVAAGETHLAAVLAKAVAEWFVTHVESMDKVLALFLTQPELAQAAMQCGPGCETSEATAASAQTCRVE